MRAYAAGHKMNYPVLRGTSDTSERYGSVEALPSTLILGRDGSRQSVSRRSKREVADRIWDALKAARVSNRAVSAEKPTA